MLSRWYKKMQGIKNYLKNFPGWGYEPGVVKKVIVTPKQAKLAKKVQEKIPIKQSLDYFLNIRPKKEQKY